MEEWERQREQEVRGANVGGLAKFKDQKRPEWFKGVG